MVRGLAYSHIVVLVTAANREETEKIARCLLDEKLISCANILGPVHSLFWWMGKIEKAEEYVLLMKTRADMFKRLSERVKAMHSYEVPEIVALPIVEGFKPYMEWLNNSLRSSE
ncbi:MAG: divalent-cation tolerance protein CutA [Candidatus Bathyarchaeia archaeon]